MPTLPLDSAIPALAAANTIRTTYIVDIATPTPRRFTTYPNGITVGSIVGTLSVTAGGSGFTSAPTVTISGGGGQGAAAIALVSGGAVTALVITSRGWGYTSAPTVAFSGGAGTGATATATLGATFSYVGAQVSAVAETGDGTSVVEGSLVIPLADNAYTDLVTNAANLRAAVSIQRVWRNAVDAVAATEIWLEGFTGRPSFAGEYLTLACHADAGRRGTTPRTQWRDVMTSHTPPSASKKIPWLTATRVGG